MVRGRAAETNSGWACRAWTIDRPDLAGRRAVLRQLLVVLGHRRLVARGGVAVDPVGRVEHARQWATSSGVRTSGIWIIMPDS
jgi:hypothetical protein